MRAIVIERYGGPEVLSLRDIAQPVAAAGEVLVRVDSAGINFMDIGTRSGRYARSQTYRVGLPCTLGMEGAGTIVALGEGVSRFAIGDRVTWCIAWGSYAEYAAVPQDLVANIPDAISFEQAAAAMFQGCTAHYLVHDVAALQPGSTCLVHAAAGAIGQIIVQLAKSAGARVFATASSADKRAVARARGADHVMPYGDGAFADEVRTLTDGRGVNVVFDSVGLSTLRDSFRATRKKGLVINYGSVSGSVQDLDPLELGEAGSLFLTRPRLADHLDSALTVKRRADAIFGAIVAGQLQIDVAARYTLDTVQLAHARMEAREQVGKPVLCIANSA